MKLAMIGLGRMGSNMARRLMAGGHEIVGYDHDPDAVAELGKAGATGATSLDDVLAKLPKPAIVWLMLPAGEVTEAVMRQVAELSAPGDIIVDGGNSFWKHDLERAKWLAERHLDFVDVGTSGGVWGLERGYCMMIGGRQETIAYLDPIFATLAPGLGSISRTANERYKEGEWRAEKGYIHAGPAGAGHFVKMVHNGIEYGLMQAYAEGFDILKGRANARLPEDERFELNMPDVAEVWRRGSVISSWLLDLCALELARDHDLNGFTGSVADSGEGQWTIDAAMEEAIPANVLATALFARYRSRMDHGFADKLLSAMRFGFGGHVEVPQ
jgi:6-phosphogluconate dehydrogenase